jgi:hypothetical protein
MTFLTMTEVADSLSQKTTKLGAFSSACSKICSIPGQTGRGATDRGSESPACAGLLQEPSDGLEPSTPSLPWRFRGVTCGHARSLATQFFLQIFQIRRRTMRRETSRVSCLMCPFCVRGALTSEKFVKTLRAQSSVVPGSCRQAPLVVPRSSQGIVSCRRVESCWRAAAGRSRRSRSR